MSRKVHKLDAERTKKAYFLDSRSYWTVNGKEYLFGKDMEIQRDVIYMLDGRRCQAENCGRKIDLVDMELDHYPVSRGRGGDDSLTNLRAICKPCHRKRHVQVRWTKKVSV